MKNTSDGVCTVTIYVYSVQVHRKCSVSILLFSPPPLPLPHLSEHLHDDSSISDQHDHDDDEDPNHVHCSHQTYPPQTTTTSPTTNVWNRVSFCDIILSQVQGLADKVVDPQQQQEPSPEHNMTLSNNKPRLTFVMTAAAPNPTTMQRQGRRYESTSNLRSSSGSLVSSLSFDENLILDETDASMGLYHSKAKGFVSHKNGLQ